MVGWLRGWIRRLAAFDGADELGVGDRVAVQRTSQQAGRAAFGKAGSQPITLGGGLPELFGKSFEVRVWCAMVLLGRGWRRGGNR